MSIGSKESQDIAGYCIAFHFNSICSCMVTFSCPCVHKHTQITGTPRNHSLASILQPLPPPLPPVGMFKSLHLSVLCTCHPYCLELMVSFRHTLIFTGLIVLVVLTLYTNQILQQTKTIMQFLICNTSSMHYFCFITVTRLFFHFKQMHNGSIVQLFSVGSTPNQLSSFENWHNILIRSIQFTILTQLEVFTTVVCNNVPTSRSTFHRETDNKKCVQL